jgi:predicted acetyltransferase
MYCDSQSAIHLVKNWMYHEMTKYTDVRYLFSLDIMLSGVVLVNNIATIKNLVDMSTNPIFIVKSKHCLNFIDLSSTWKVLDGGD